MPPGAGLKKRKDTDLSNDSFGDELQLGLNFDSQRSRSTAKFNLVDAVGGSIRTGESSEERESIKK